MVASSSIPLFSHLSEMNDEEKYGIIARFIPCDRCSHCKGWHPYDTTNNDCHCGHDTFHHIDNGQDLDRRLKVALRLTELLEVKIYISRVAPYNAKTKALFFILYVFF